jgi:hypothetical protein
MTDKAKVIDLQDLDPELIDQAIRRVLATPRSPERELAIATHLGGSTELLEWAEMIYDERPPHPAPRVTAMSKILTAVAVGLEIGYQLGIREAERGRSRG